MEFAQLLAAVAAVILVAYGATRARRGKKRTPSTQRRVSFVEQPRVPYPGDFTGTVAVEYSPRKDGRPDPGEIVWTWVPYEEDHTRGKDRPVLLIGRDHEWLLGLQLTSKDHDRDSAQEARAGRRWMDIGSGSWDRQGRPSEVRLDRVVRVSHVAVRREGAQLDKKVFEAVCRSL